MQFRHAVGMLGINIVLHCIQLTVLIAPVGALIQGEISGQQYLIFVIVSIVIIYLCELVFNRRILARSIARYRDRALDKWTRFIAFGYLVLNLGLTVLILATRIG